MQVNNEILRPYATLVPRSLFDDWLHESPSPYDHYETVDGHSLSLAEIDGIICCGAKERSGAFGASWVSIKVGTTSTSHCNNKHIFSWHYHPSGPMAFSFQDWLVFLISDAMATALFTPEGISLYTKRDCPERMSLSLSLSQIWSCAQSRPSMSLLKARRLMENYVGMKLFPEPSDHSIAEKLNIDYVCWGIDE